MVGKTYGEGWMCMCIYRRGGIAGIKAKDQAVDVEDDVPYVGIRIKGALGLVHGDHVSRNTFSGSNISRRMGISYAFAVPACPPLHIAL